LQPDAGTAVLRAALIASSGLEGDRPLDSRPHAHRRDARLERAGRAQNLAEILDRLPARHARREVLLEVGAIARLERPVDVFVDGVFVRMHIARSPAAVPARDAACAPRT